MHYKFKVVNLETEERHYVSTGQEINDIIDELGLSDLVKVYNDGREVFHGTAWTWSKRIKPKRFYYDNEPLDVIKVQYINDLAEAENWQLPQGYDGWDDPDLDHSLIEFKNGCEFFMEGDFQTLVETTMVMTELDAKDLAKSTVRFYYIVSEGFFVSVVG